MHSRQFYAGVAIWLSIGLLVSAALVEQGLVTAQRRSPLMELQIVSGVADLVLLWPLYRPSRGSAAVHRPKAPGD